MHPKPSSASTEIDTGRKQLDACKRNAACRFGCIGNALPQLHPPRTQAKAGATGGYMGFNKPAWSVHVALIDKRSLGVGKGKRREGLMKG